MNRLLLQSSFLALVALTPFSAGASVASGYSEVVVVQSARIADLVLLGDGFDAGFRQGMVCRVSRAGSAIGEIVLVDLRPSCSSGLIVSLATGKSIHAGDIASVKILKN